jgi:hypothetical protein
MVMKYLKRLCKTTLYKLEKVRIIDKWEQVFIENKEAYEDETYIENEEFDEENNEEPITKTLVHAFTDTYNIFDLHNNQINIAPGEGYVPLGIFQDKYSEEMSFPSLFYGEK